MAVKLADSEDGQSRAWAGDEGGEEEEQIIITCPCHLERVRGEPGSDPMAAIPKTRVYLSLYSRVDRQGREEKGRSREGRVL